MFIWWIRIQWWWIMLEIYIHSIYYILVLPLRNLFHIFSWYNIYLHLCRTVFPISTYIHISLLAKHTILNYNKYIENGIRHGMGVVVLAKSVYKVWMFCMKNGIQCNCKKKNIYEKIKEKYRDKDLTFNKIESRVNTYNMQDIHTYIHITHRMEKESFS